MPYYLGNYIEQPIARVELIYHKVPEQLIIDRYDVYIQSEGEPVPASYKGKKAVLVMNDNTGEVYYEYKDRPLTEEELKEQRFAWLATISTKSKVLANELSTEDLIKLAEMYPNWEVGITYSVNDVISYKNELYKVIQSHTSQADWSPDVVASLYTKVTPEGVIAEWSQPTGAHDAYSLGEQVTYNGKTWISDIDNNVWEPGIYGWSIVE